VKHLTSVEIIKVRNKKVVEKAERIAAKERYWAFSEKVALAKAAWRDRVTRVAFDIFTFE